MNYYKIKFLSTAVLLTLSLLGLSQVPRTGLVRVFVAPDHKDWNYKVNEVAKFSVSNVVLKDGTTEFLGTMKVPDPSFFRYSIVGPAEIETCGYYDAVNFARFSRKQDTGYCLSNGKLYLIILENN